MVYRGVNVAKESTRFAAGCINNAVLTDAATIGAATENLSRGNQMHARVAGRPVEPFLCICMTRFRNLWFAWLRVSFFHELVREALKEAVIIPASDQVMNASWPRIAVGYRDKLCSLSICPRRCGPQTGKAG